MNLLEYSYNKIVEEFKRDYSQDFITTNVPLLNNDEHNVEEVISEIKKCLTDEQFKNLIPDVSYLLIYKYNGYWRDNNDWTQFQIFSEEKFCYNFIKENKSGANEFHKFLLAHYDEVDFQE